ncbi:MAG: signal recognition particle-docking protein FtsY [Cyanophyceae cyanobacterium]
MVFNWFRRQYDEKSKPEEQPETGAETTSESAESETIAAESEDVGPESGDSAADGADGDASGDASDEDEVSLDYLAWAKAAYQNVQQQAEEATEAEEAEVAEADVTEATEALEDVEAADEETADEETADERKVAAEATEDVEEADEETAEGAAEDTETIEASVTEATAESAAGTEITETPVTEPPQEPEPPQEAAAPVSFLERAEAEREERVERVKAEAILPEPDPMEEEEEPPEPIIEFDENFIWSAEVLAAQGRRPEDVSLEEISWLNQLRKGLDKTRQGLVNDLKSVFGQGPLNDEAIEEIEALLLQADVGVTATDLIIDALQEKLREETLPPDEAIAYLKKILRDLLDEPARKPGDDITMIPMLVPEKEKLNIWLMTGVNGAGKTTTIGKLARLATKSDYRCLIAAADTFRAAAVEQVQEWGRRSGVDVVANPGQNTDPAAVVFDAISAAQSRDIELLLVDTAGRLQNKKNLMEELSKMRRIVDKKAPGTYIESLLVLDATLGQNGLQQAKLFAEAAQLSGVVLTKLDGTAKGGVAIAVAQQLKLPIRFIGAGEKVEDLRPFSSYEFVEALLNG